MRINGKNEMKDPLKISDLWNISWNVFGCFEKKPTKTTILVALDVHILVKEEEN